MKETAFDYAQAIAELEKIAAEVEDPYVDLDKMDSALKRSSELVEQCRAYLRSAREKLDSLV